MSRPVARLPWPPIPLRLNQPLVTGKVPARWPSTARRPAAEKTIKIRYSTVAIPIWARAVIRIPATAIASMISHTAVPMPVPAQASAELEPNTASTDGPSTTTSATVPIT